MGKKRRGERYDILREQEQFIAISPVRIELTGDTTDINFFVENKKIARNVTSSSEKSQELQPFVNIIVVSKTRPALKSQRDTRNAKAFLRRRGVFLSMLRNRPSFSELKRGACEDAISDMSTLEGLDSVAAHLREFYPESNRRAACR